MGVGQGGIWVHAGGKSVSRRPYEHPAACTILGMDPIQVESPGPPTEDLRDSIWIYAIS